MATTAITITQTGVHEIAGAPTSGSLEVLGGQVSVKSNVNLTFPHVSPPLTIAATSGRDIDIPTGHLSAGQALTMQTNANVDVSGWVRTRVNVATATTPVPVPEPEPPPPPVPVPVPGQESANCTKAGVVIDEALRQWSINSGWVMVDGEYAINAGAVMGAKATDLKYVTKVVYGLEPRDGNWYRYDLAQPMLERAVLVGPTEPTCQATTEPPVPTVPTPPPTPVPAGVLGRDDIQYLGSFRMPTDGVYDGSHPPYYFNYSDGALTGRRVGGVPTLLIQGHPIRVNQPHNPELIELSIPEPSMTDPPRAGLVRAWTDIRNDKTQCVGGVGGSIRGLAIDPENPTHLWVGYKQFYNNDPNPNTVLTVLNDNGTCRSEGPWRHGGGGYQVDPQDSTGATNAHFTPIPESLRAVFGGKRLASGAVNLSYLAGLSYGCNLHAWNPVEPGTPPNAVDGLDYAIADVPLLHFPEYRRQRRLIEGVNFKLCDWTPVTDAQPEKYDSSRGAIVTDPIPIFGGADLRPTKDESTCAVMVDTGTKRGVVFFGQLTETLAGHVYENGSPQECHSWYGVNTIDKHGKRNGDDGYLGAACCPHGQGDRTWLGTGNGAGTTVGYCWIFDPADLAPVAARSVDPWTPNPVAAFRLSSIKDCNIPEEITTYQQYGGAWYDEVTRRIYVAASNYDNEGPYAPVPRVHVFQVNA